MKKEVSVSLGAVHTHTHTHTDNLINKKRIAILNVGVRALLIIQNIKDSNIKPVIDTG